MVLHLEVGELAIFRQHVFEQPAEARDVPLVIPQFVDHPVFGFLGRGLKRLIEGRIGPLHAQFSAENQQGFAHRFDDGLSQNPCFVDRRHRLLPVGLAGAVESGINTCGGVFVILS